MKPKVSVAILVHGSLAHLRRSVDSVLAQTYGNIELIVVHDGPNDESVMKEILMPYGDKIKYYQKGDKGVAAALNFALKKATGEYFSWLAHNDTYLPQKVEKEVTLINSSDDVIAVSGWTMVNRNNRVVKTYPIEDTIEQYSNCYFAFSKDTQVNTCAMLFPMKMVKSRLFDESLPAARDYNLLRQLVEAGAKFSANKGPALNYSSVSEHRYLSDPKVQDNPDFLHSDLINSLQYSDIFAYFGSRESIITYCRELLDSSRPRSAAFLMKKVITGLLQQKDSKAAEQTLLNDLSGLPQAKMDADAETLLSKVIQPSEKKKILFSSARWLTGGMERVMSILFRELEGDYEIFLITPHSDTESHIAIPDHVISIKISDENFQGHFDAMILSYALLLDIDVVIGCINLFKKQLNLYQLCVGTKVKTVASNHEYYFYPYTSSAHYDVVEKRLNAYQTCDAIVWPTNFNAALCGMYVENNYVIGNPNNFEVASKISSPKEKVIICVGRFNDNVKRIDRILRCFSLILDKVPDAKLVLVGKYDNDAPVGPNNKMSVNNLIEELAIPPSSINFVGEVGNVEDYYARASALMLTSNSEGFGMVLNEAACFGVPSVGNYIPGIEDIIIDGQNGYITEQDDLATMAKKVSDILADDSLRKKLGNNARERAKLYDTKHIGDKWRHLINSLLETKDENDLRKKLNRELGYRAPDQQLLSNVLAKEINEIFYKTINEGSRHRITDGTLLILTKAIGLPKRLRANIEYEGLPKTTSKIATRTYRIVRNKLKR